MNIHGKTHAGSVDCKNHHLHRLIHRYLMIHLFAYANVVSLCVYTGAKKGTRKYAEKKKLALKNSNNRLHREKGNRGEKSSNILH